MERTPTARPLAPKGDADEGDLTGRYRPVQTHVVPLTQIGDHQRFPVAQNPARQPLSHNQVGSLAHRFRCTYLFKLLQCQTCHAQDEETLETRIITIQNRTAELLRLSEDAIIDAIDAIVAAQEAGATDEQLERARELHRSASLRWDFVSSENSTGFHSPQEAARILGMAIDFARQAQLEAERVTNEVGGS